jgi:YHS domain-containing protein
MRKNAKYSKGAFAVLLLACATTAFAGKVDAIFTHAGLAIRGYDPVVYHLQAQPAKGAPQFSYQWRGATWLFATAENRDRFQAEPERYAPQDVAGRRWEAVFELQQGRAEEVGARRTREHQQGRQELARFTQVILAHLGTGRSGGAPDDAGL